MVNVTDQVKTTHFQLWLNKKTLIKEEELTKELLKEFAFIHENLMKEIIILLFSFIITSFNTSYAISEISSFIYQLQNVKQKELLETDFDIGVIDIDDANFLLSQMQELKNQGKIIISYLSIGEAENYRDYWIEGDFDNNPPDFLDEENPDFEGNFKVKFWDPNWQEIIFNRLNEIIDDGYDGVYLDIIDAYSFFEERGRTTARQEMEDFVAEIAKRGRERMPDFLIIPQNAAELVEDESYLQIIDGLGKEDTFFFDNRKIKKKIVQEDLTFLKIITDAGKFVLATDYPTNKRKQCKFIKKAKENNLVPFVSNRDLDKIDFPICGN